MFKKRKLNPATLEELAKRYPQNIISDEEAKNIIGGIHYYDLSSGTYIATIGSSEEIRFVSRSVYDQFITNNGNSTSGVVSPSVNEYDNDVYNASSSWNRGLSSAQLSIISKEARAMFPKDTNGNDIRVKAGTTDYAMGLTENGELLVNLNFSEMGNMANIRSLLIHELYHYQQGHQALGSGNATGIEIEAIMAQIADPSWSSVSRSLKEQTAKDLEKHGYTEAQARALVGI